MLKFRSKTMGLQGGRVGAGEWGVGAHCITTTTTRSRAVTYHQNRATWAARGAADRCWSLACTTLCFRPRRLGSERVAGWADTREQTTACGSAVFWPWCHPRPRLSSLERSPDARHGHLHSWLLYLYLTLALTQRRACKLYIYIAPRAMLLDGWMCEWEMSPSPSISALEVHSKAESSS